MPGSTRIPFPHLGVVLDAFRHRMDARLTIMLIEELL
jgi:hypothetical protein